MWILVLVLGLLLGVVGLMAITLVSLVLGALGLVYLLDNGWPLSIRAGRRLRTLARSASMAVIDRSLRLDRRLRPFPWVRRLVYASAALTLAVSPVVSYVTWYIYWDTHDVPDVQVLLNWQPPQIGYLNDRNDRVVMRAATQYRHVITYEELPPVAQDALISAEDKRFWEHDGWDTIATTRATLKAIFMRIGHFRQQGASTITQQVARNIYLYDWLERQHKTELIIDNPATRLLARIKGPVWTNNATRKIREIKYAVHIERDLSKELGSDRAAKERILATYANLVYLGHGVYGIDYAARFYLDKEAKQMDPADAAFIASLIPAPDLYVRLNAANGQEQKARRDAVLKRMADNGYIERDEYRRLIAQPITMNIQLVQAKTDAPAVVQFALEELAKRGFTQQQLHRGDIQLTLTSDQVIQQAVNTAAWQGIHDRFRKHFEVTGPLPQTAIVVMRNGTGEVLAMHGGFVEDDVRYNYATYNRATEARRQPGSSFKLFDMVAAVMAGLTPDSIVMDVPATVSMGNGHFKTIGNYDGKTLGPIPLRQATAQSRNLAYLNMMRSQVGGAAPAIKWAREMGVKSHMDPYISTVLGSNGMTPLELANAYRTVCSAGVEADPFIIGQVTDRQGKVIYENHDRTRSLPIPSEKLALVHELLRGTIKLPKGTGHSLDTSAFPIQLMGKTGTSNDHKDAWFTGCTYGPSGITITVWVGYDDFGKALPAEGRAWYDRASGGVVALPIAKDIFLQVYGAGKPLGEPPPFPKAIEDRIDGYLQKATAGS